MSKFQINKVAEKVKCVVYDLNGEKFTYPMHLDSKTHSFKTGEKTKCDVSEKNYATVVFVEPSSHESHDAKHFCGRTICNL